MMKFSNILFFAISCIFSSISLFSVIDKKCLGQVQDLQKSANIKTATDMTSKYQLVKQFSSGAGGGSVYHVKENGQSKVLKILDNSEDMGTESRKELLYTCINSKITENPFGVKDEVVQPFPTLYEMGRINTNQPFASSGQKGDFIYMVIEFIDGMELLKMAENSNEAVKNLGVALDSNKYKTKIVGILLQVAKAIEVAHKNYNFVHRDLHAGNIIALKNKSVQMNDKLKTKVPLVKIIDFGLSTSDQYPREFQHEGARLVPTKANTALYQSLHKSYYATAASALSTALYGQDDIKNDDTAYFNLLLYILQGSLDQPNQYTYCSTMSKCVEVLKNMIQ